MLTQQVVKKAHMSALKGLQQKRLWPHSQGVRELLAHSLTNFCFVLATHLIIETAPSLHMKRERRQTELLLSVAGELQFEMSLPVFEVLACCGEKVKGVLRMTVGCGDCNI